MGDIPAIRAARTTRSGGLTALAAAFIIIVAAVGLEYPRWGATFTPARVFFAGPDDYMRVYRARQIARGHTFRVGYMPEISAPVGASHHWTAPMDYLIVGAARLCGPVLRGINHADSLGCVAACLPVLLGAAFLACMIALIHRSVGSTPALLIGLIVALSPPFHRVFQLGHPDHHGLLELLFVIALGGVLPRHRKDEHPGDPTRRSAILSGLATGLAIWVASEALLIWFVILAGFSLACLYGPPISRRRWASARLVWNLSVAAMVAGGYLFENWHDLNVVAIDKISLFHVFLAGIAFLAPGHVPASEPVRPLQDGTPVPREPSRAQSQTTLNVALLTAVAAFLIWLRFQDHAVFEYVSRPEFARWSAQIEELQPLYVRTDDAWSLQQLHRELGYAIYALPLAWMFFIRSPRIPRAMRTTAGLLAPVIAILTVRYLRWMDHYSVAVVPVIVLGLWQALRSWAPRDLRDRPVALFVTVGLVLAALNLPAATNVLSRRTQGEISVRRYVGRADFVAQQIRRQEADPSNLGDARRRTILCDDMDGPVLLYYTGLPVVATPYHRAINGLIEVARFFAETDPTAARDQLDRLGVRYIVVPPRINEQLMHYEQIAFGELRSFDKPDLRIDELGLLQQTLHYRRSQVVRTMAYRLQNDPLQFPDRRPPPVIPGVELIARIRENPQTPSRSTGLLYMVHDRPGEAGESAAGT